MPGSKPQESIGIFRLVVRTRSHTYVYSVTSIMSYMCAQSPRLLMRSVSCAPQVVGRWRQILPPENAPRVVRPHRLLLSALHIVGLSARTGKAGLSTSPGQARSRALLACDMRLPFTVQAKRARSRPEAKRKRKQRKPSSPTLACTHLHDILNGDRELRHEPAQHYDYTEYPLDNFFTRRHLHLTSPHLTSFAAELSGLQSFFFFFFPLSFCFLSFFSFLFSFDLGPFVICTF